MYKEILPEYKWDKSNKICSASLYSCKSMRHTTVPKKQNDIKIGSEPENKDKEKGRTSTCNKKATWKELK